ncbi:MAG: ribosome-associated translation inhibitor RaiA [Bacteroidales bacterium]|nr:ribosome-associated translation inhibitor RaiA [Bacteroidales bacterium]
MEVKITSIHFNADQKLEDYITEKVDKLTQFDEELLSTEVNLSLEKPVGKNFDSKVVKIKVKTKGVDYFAEKKADTFETAANEAIDAVEIQVKKRKEKISKKK